MKCYTNNNSLYNHKKLRDLQALIMYNKCFLKTK